MELTIETNLKLYSQIQDIVKSMRVFQNSDLFSNGITFTEFNIMHEIYHRKVMKMIDLRGILQIEKSSLTRLLNPLLKKEVIARERSFEDPRQYNICLTENGDNVYNEMFNELNHTFDDIINPVPKKEMDELFKNFKLFSGIMESFK